MIGKDRVAHDGDYTWKSRTLYWIGNPLFFRR